MINKRRSCWTMMMMIMVSTLLLLISLTTTAVKANEWGVNGGNGNEKDSANTSKDDDDSNTADDDNDDKATVLPNIILLFMDDLGYGDVGYNGHPTTSTPNIDKLAYNGKILTSWYSGCNVCSGSRAALMTGRQFTRNGLPGVIGPTTNIGLPLNETTIAEQLKTKGYTTGIVGKWHLGQRQVYMPGNRGFDYYLGIPYSDDMGFGYKSTCPTDETNQATTSAAASSQAFQQYLQDHGIYDGDNNSNGDGNDTSDYWSDMYKRHYMLEAKLGAAEVEDPAGNYLPLVMQKYNRTYVVEQPLDFTYLTEKYNEFVLQFIHSSFSQQTNPKQHHDVPVQQKPFFLYLPFSHVHTTRGNIPNKQYSNCDFTNTTKRGIFGDALAESDWIVGNIMTKLKELHIENNTLVLFSSDNGPWMAQGLSAGSEGLFTGRYSGFWNTGKGSTWEGGIRMPAFAYWKGKIMPYSRSSEVISSLDVFPTLSSLVGIPLPKDRVYDGRDMTSVLFSDSNSHSKFQKKNIGVDIEENDYGDADGASKREFLFFYGTCNKISNNAQVENWSVTAVRHGSYKAHWCTGPGLEPGNQPWNHTGHIKIYDRYPLLFNIDKDPSESEPLNAPGNVMPSDPEHQAVMTRILKAYAMEKSTFVFGEVVPEPDGPNEGPGLYGICCDRARNCSCTAPSSLNGRRSDETYHESVSFRDYLMKSGIFNVGSKQQHDIYHELLGEKEPSPPRTRAQWLLQQQQQPK